MAPEEYKKEYGFAQVTRETLLEPAEAIRFFGFGGALMVTSPGQVPLKYWIDTIQSPTIDLNVPKEIRTLFEVAKGCITYGVLFYPLFSIGTEQLFRLCETAIRDRAQSFGGHHDLHFKDAITFLIKKGVILEENRFRWDAIWSFRNSTSHPTMQMIIPPAQAAGFLTDVADDINYLMEFRNN